VLLIDDAELRIRRQPDTGTYGCGAVEAHIDFLRECGEPVPLPTTTDGTMDVTAA
jgi:hypothetical protein